MYDVIVIGAGHAGVEAAAAAARRGARVALFVLDRSTIGAMSCNPAIGGLGKGHIVREIDAFDGLMGVAADAAAIHHRMLNRSKGKAVQGPRVQADRRRYSASVRTLLAGYDRIEIVAAEVVELVLRGSRVTGVMTGSGEIVGGRSVVLATGTFLGGRIFRGDERADGGRVGERAAGRLAEQLRDVGVRAERLKTGTPPRLDARSIDWASLEEQPSDGDDWTMSSLTARRRLPQLSCAISRTTARTHDVVRDAFDRSPLFSGAIEASGPRYCPSIEDKIARFGDRDGHQIFLEPEGLDYAVVYPNGLSTSLPTDVQAAMLATIPGLERARIMVPGYAVEYDYLDPRALDHRLASLEIEGLFCAGQINGTTGYEEAAGQGLIAGLNAAAHALAIAPVTLDRASSYIGVMIDDLVLQGVTEPYRMLTARAEFRLSLRADNAETRLASIAARAACIGVARRAHQDRRRSGLDALRRLLTRRYDSAAIRAAGCDVPAGGPSRPLTEWLQHDGVTIEAVIPSAKDEFGAAVIDEASEDARYAPYLIRQAEEIARLRRDDRLALDPMLDWSVIPGLSSEMIDRLTIARPESLAAVARIRGITPAALSAIHLHAHRRAA